MTEIKDNIEQIQSKLPSRVALVAVSKRKPIEDIKAAYDYGVLDFGENKVQEFLTKVDELPKDIRWHFIGHLQSNKVRKIIGKIALIHSLDRNSLAKEIQRISKEEEVVTECLIEINIGEEPQKSGILLKNLDNFIEKLKDYDHIKVKGLMAIIPQGTEEENRIYFKKMHELFLNLKEKESERFSMDILSMGMSNDYKIAMEEGSNMVRVGTLIFGERTN
ncbi:MAG: YggS family pyridoxal phosphate-dependent enzyme [Clostridium sp.]|nr:YggS family pyridoxal phosphate-dependent enzyme [Clostridium sp.]